MKRLLAAALAIASAGFVSADSLYFVSDSNNHELYRMDLGTMAVTDIGSLGIDGSNATFGDLAYNASKGVMYYSGGRGDNNLYTVNLSTGAATLVGSHGQNDLFALGYDPATGSLYGGASTGAFGTVNSATGAGNFFANTGVYNEGLTYNSKTSQMILEGTGDTYSIDVTTGALTSLGHFNDGTSNVNLNDNGITYDSNRSVYWDYDYSGFLREVNSSTLTVINTYTPNYGVVSSVAYVGSPAPEPATLALVGMGAAALLRRRSRAR